LFYFFIDSCKEKKISLGNKISFNKEKLHYGSVSEQIMDLYIPHKKSEKKRSFHYYSWWRLARGNKSQLTFFTLSLMQSFRSYFCQYELQAGFRNPLCLTQSDDDIREVSKFLEKKLHYSPKLILLGNSAGGHLSMLYAYHFDPLKKVKAVINIVGPADLSDPSFRNYQEYSFVERRLVDPRIPEPGISRIDFASPIHWITQNTPPTLSYYGKTDRVIPATQGKILDSVLSKNNVIHEAYEFNGGHLDWDRSPNDLFLIDKIDLFLKRIDKK
jgi:acetyl esterase/lipase